MTVGSGLGHAHGSDMMDSLAHMGTRQELQIDAVDVTIGHPGGEVGGGAAE